MVQDMLNSIFIQSSRSSFLALILDCEKIKDNYWRMFLYIYLNKITINNKLCIPNIYELLGEPHVVAYSTKNDLKDTTKA